MANQRYVCECTNCEGRFEKDEHYQAANGVAMAGNERLCVLPGHKTEGYRQVAEGEGWAVLEEETDAAKLVAILDRVYRFPHNVSLHDLLRQVHGGDSETNAGYLLEKQKLLDRKGFTWWWCELDDANQKRVAKAMLDRYKDLAGLIK